MLSKQLEAFRLKVAKFPDNLLYRFSFAQQLSAHGKSEEAIEHLEICLAKRDDWMIPFFVKAKLGISLDRKLEAISSLKKTIELAKAQSHDDPLVEAQELLDSLI